MSRGSAKLTETRISEIVDACAALYEQKPYKEIKLQEIADATTITRTAMYTYFQTKEEIFLCLLAREYERWNEDLQKIIDENESLSADEFAHAMAKSLEGKIRLLKLNSMNIYELEDNSRMERIVEYKKGLGGSMKLVREILRKFFTEKSEDEIEALVYAIFPLLFGVYPYSVINSRAAEAMEKAEADYHYYSTYDITYRGIRLLMGA